MPIKDDGLEMDTILRGSIAGSVALIIALSVSWILYMFGVLPSTGSHYSAMFITSPGTPLTTLPLLLGSLTNLVTGALVGVVIAFLFKRTGNDYWWLKSVGLGVVLWPVHVTFIPALIAPRLYTLLPPIMVFASLLLSALYGIVAGLVLKLEIGFKHRV